MEKSLPAVARQVIDKYLHLPLGGKLVQCPYFKNRQGVRVGIAVFLGKGSPEEIVEETALAAKRHYIALVEMTQTEIRSLMLKNNLGVDCSGFICQVLSRIDIQAIQKIAANTSGKSFWRRIIARHRPAQNISAHDLSGHPVAKKLDQWQSIHPGDIIRTRQGHHVLLVSAVSRNSAGALQDFTYHHATSYYGASHGVRQGSVIAIKPNKPLADQDWLEKDDYGRNYTQEGFLDDDGRNGVYRLRDFPFHGKGTKEGFKET